MWCLTAASLIFPTLVGVLDAGPSTSLLKGSAGSTGSAGPGELWCLFCKRCSEWLEHRMTRQRPQLCLFTALIDVWDTCVITEGEWLWFVRAETTTRHLRNHLPSFSVPPHPIHSLFLKSFECFLYMRLCVAGLSPEGSFERPSAISSFGPGMFTVLMWCSFEQGETRAWESLVVFWVVAPPLALSTVALSHLQ
jgi:hypothetical protein